MVPDFGDDSSWYVDMGATNHVANTFDVVDTAIPYNGTETLAVGNGKKLVISHIGSASLPSSSNSCPLHLKFVLHVPAVTKNLVSVSQLTPDNDVFLEFHKHCCFIKDKGSRTVLLKGKAKDGLNLLGDDSSLPNSSLQCHLASISSTHSCSSGCTCHKSHSSCINSAINKNDFTFSLPSSTRVVFHSFKYNDINNWHGKLGHPSSQTLAQLLPFFLPHSGSLKDLQFCASCQQGKSHKKPFSLSTS